MGVTLEIGSRGEEAAARWLQANGYEVLHRNWRSGRYELDIIARKDGILHIVEVKCRRSGGLTAPHEAITPAKFKSLRNAAQAYIEAFEVDSEIQFDLISVLYDDSGEMTVGYVPEAMLPRW